jgi:hypothetical protein
VQVLAFLTEGWVYHAFSFLIPRLLGQMTLSAAGSGLEPKCGDSVTDSSFDEGHLLIALRLKPAGRFLGEEW